jgi:AraC-like DNA-binding protein
VEPSADQRVAPRAGLKLDQARRAQRLLRSALPIAEVAAEVGFSDQSHLTRHFKRLLGFTPGSYRRAWARG